MSDWDNVDLQAFYDGRDFSAWRWMGARLNGDGADFRVCAPAASGVSVLLSAANRPGEPPIEKPMQRCLNGSFFEAHVPGVREGDAYEYRIYGHNGSYCDHADPYGRGMELRPRHRSIVRDLGKYEFGDAAWMAARTPGFDRPLNIYELHAGSWRMPEHRSAAGSDPAGASGPDAAPADPTWYTYDELAAPLIEHVRSLGCTHVELMPLAEYPFDGSWGYQTTGFFSPTSRYGTPQQLMALIDALHQAGIGVILDFVPTHFATDDYGLANFDGTPLYEYPNDAVGVSEWGSHNFMHSRGEVRSLLASAADLWLGVYHFDGLRMDAVSRIIYWQGDERRGVNGMGTDFLRELTRGLHARHPGCALIAEDSSAFEGVTRPSEQGGLGFDYKWDLGWMHDTLSYFQAPPDERRRAQGRLTFSMMYFGNERYLLPFSHDEVVHGKATIAQKMNGGYEGKFCQARALYLYMMAHPGKKLDFMGNEFAQLREWDEKREQDWMLLSYPVHDAFLRFRRELGEAYRVHPALWERDYEPDGFQWLDCEQLAPCCTAILRRARSGERVAVLFNLDGQKHEYAVPLPEGEGSAAGHAPGEAAAAAPRVILDTDWQRFGGSTPDGATVCEVAAGQLRCELAPCSGVLVLLGA